jgi:hypothetical protein
VIIFIGVDEQANLIAGAHRRSGCTSKHLLAKHMTERIETFRAAFPSLSIPSEVRCPDHAPELQLVGNRSDSAVVPGTASGNPGSGSGVSQR